MPVEIAEPPTTTETEPALPNPVIPEGLDLSKKLFNEAMEAEKPKAPEPEKIDTTLVKEGATSTSAPERTKTEQVVEPEKDKGDVKTDVVPSAKSKLPEELITGKKPEPKVDDAIAEIDAMVLPKNAKPEQVASFAKLKEQSKKVIEEKLARINELESKTSEGATRAEIEAAQERVKAAEAKSEELESTIERLAFTESPRFKQFLTDEAATLASAKSYFEGTEINPEIVEYAARTNGAQRIKILREAGMDAELIAAVQPYLAHYDNIQRYKSGALENWKTESAQMADQNKAQQEAELARRREGEDKVWETVAGRLKNEVAGFQKFDAQDDWNERSDKYLAEWKRVYNGDGVDLETVADYLGKGIAYEAEHEIRMAVTDELNKALQENAKLKAAKPNGGSTQVAGQNGQVKNESEMTPTERTEFSKSMFNQELAKVRGQ